MRTLTISDETRDAPQGANAPTPNPIPFEEPVVEEALRLLNLLSERRIETSHARFALAVALLMLCPDLTEAQRVLEVADQRHAVAGFDLHQGVRARAP